MTYSGKLMPNLDQHSTKLLNLTVLQRIDPFIEEILITAAHVAFYGFNVDLSQWSRKDVEGSLFVVKRNAQPRFQFIVMNRRNTNNLVEKLLGDFEYEVQVPYLLYRNAAQEVHGIWFYNAQECEEVANLFGRILNAYSRVPQKSKISSVNSEFQELEAVPTIAVMDGPLEPPSSTASNIVDVPDDPSFRNFFSAEIGMGNATHATVVGQPTQSSAIIPSPSVPICVASPAAPSLQMPLPSPPLSSSAPLMPLLHTAESVNKTIKTTTNLVKPSSFFTPPAMAAPSIPSAPPLHSAGNIQSPYGAPMLQPFPPPTPSPSLTPPSFTSSNLGQVISKEKVREALVALLQEDQFIDMVYRALQNAHNSM